MPLTNGDVHATLHDVLPDDAILVVESPTSTMALRNRVRLSRPGSWFFSSGGGLGYALPPRSGVQLARPGRPVVCVLGEGSAQYSITGLWTAAAYDVPVTFLILRNGEYGILKWFAQAAQVDGAPGLDLPALRTAPVAEGYGGARSPRDRPRRSARCPGGGDRRLRPAPGRGRRGAGHVRPMMARR